VQQHQLIYGALQQAVSSEAIHALALLLTLPKAGSRASGLSEIMAPNWKYTRHR